MCHKKKRYVVMSGIPLSVIGNYVLFLDVDSAGGQFLGQVGDTPEDDGVHDGGVLHVLGNALGVEVAVGVPDLTVAEVVSERVAGAEADDGHSAHHKVGVVGTAGFLRNFHRIPVIDPQCKRKSWIQIFERFTDRFQGIIPLLRHGHAVGYRRASVAVEVVDDVGEFVRMRLHPGFRAEQPEFLTCP